MVGCPRSQALIGVEVHGVDLLPVYLLQSHSRLREIKQDHQKNCKQQIKKQKQKKICDVLLAQRVLSDALCICGSTAENA